MVKGSYTLEVDYPTLWKMVVQAAVQDGIIPPGTYTDGETTFDRKTGDMTFNVIRKEKKENPK